MKVPVALAHLMRDAMGSGAITEEAARAAAEPLAFDDVYERCFDQVARWARALGGPSADVDDLAQEVFVVVNRKLARFDGRDLRAWLYRITARTVSDYRRRAWFRRMLLRERDVALESLPEQRGTPVELLERKEREQLVYRLIESMSEKRRTAFVMFEIEGYSGEEIARLEGVPIATVWTRLFHARKDFLRLVAANGDV